ncbi:6-phosphogluconolactonase, cycloisomerase 2 family [Arthrobacter sp. yr096]|uniref:lactonase family protein n=1 Tax=unclassified Arthrobacter TaxID=235627 RepID=UPI000898E716|nr:MULTISPECIES: lactonase family protein [unclassified Arthrobacter]SDX61973.1 6-phosphogluconolactonase, cycloisomerase 2 family [Arthrobacter sp. cf158]SEJ83085.1 6-phosphogluconolactonase, cycloisomerase 2 family [Arthrobacter sp. yr096]
MPVTELAYVGSRTSVLREGRGSGLEVFEILDDGRWLPRQTVGMDNPSFMVLSPRSTQLYVAHGDGNQISALELDPATGRIDYRDTVDAGGVNPVHLALSPDQQFLVVANHNSGTVASIRILPDDSLGPVAGLLSFEGETGPHRRDQNSSKPHQVVFDATGSYALVPDKGLDSIFTISIDSTGSLTWHQDRTIRLREMSGPRHVAFSPSNNFVYSIEEFLSTVTTYSWDAATGTLRPIQSTSALPDTVTGDSRGAEIAVSADGKHVYVSNRSGPGDHSPGGEFPDTIGTYDVDPDTGRLGPGRWTETHGIRPRFFCLDAEAGALLVAHERGHSIAAHPLDPTTGTPGPPVFRAATGSPVAILRHRLPVSAEDGKPSPEHCVDADHSSTL